MPLLRYARHTATFSLAAALWLCGPISSAQSSSDNSVWYQSPTQSSPPQANPTPPAAPASSPAPETRVRVRGDYYYPVGPGNSRIIFRGGRGYYGRYSWSRDYRYYRRYDTPDTSTLIELARRYDPELIGADPNAEPPTARELGERALRAGRYDIAITEFAAAADEEQRDEADSEQPSRQAKRLLGIAHAADKQFELAGQHLTEAFETDPGLRTLPIRGEDLFPDGLELNSIVSRAVGHAHRSPSYNAWFTVAVLMQAQGKNDLANTMIERAEAARAAEQSDASDTDGDGDGDSTPDTDAKPAKRERPQESEADRLRRDLQRSTERMLESQRRLEEMRRKQAEAEEAKRDKDSGTGS